MPAAVTRIDASPSAPPPTRPPVGAELATSTGKKMKDTTLPSLPPELSTKKAIVEYVNQYGFDQTARGKMVQSGYEQVERDAYEAYTKATGRGYAPKDFYVAALRMWKSGNFPLAKPPQNDLSALAISG